MNLLHTSTSLHVFTFSTVLLIIVVSTSGTTEWTGIEKPCLCQEFRCNDGIYCLDKSRVCNGVKDCPSGEDELVKEHGKCRPPKNQTCGPEEFKCKFGGCVKLTQVCDKKIDCWGGVDEASDFCTWVNSR